MPGSSCTRLRLSGLPPPIRPSESSEVPWQRFAWFVSDVTRKDWNWLLNSMVYGHLFTDRTEDELASLKRLGERWKQYEKEGKWVYEQHPFWCTGYTFIFKGDLNHRKLTYDCHAPPATPFDVAIGPLTSEASAPPVASLRTIKSDVVVGISDEDAIRLDKDEPGWKISGKYAVVLLSNGQPGQAVQFT
ncbi:hypothetical protein Pst134EA_031754 [Puccinia striiformis f. sp. tritici]|uniref:uncharacterized protein n=1 Tax=Puccinia striiformis f. sp. tritici TaxID=168172 RepID=UPI0020087FC0|nr:uncharacterized protein Pst134EA_031754 [Puccinia striiformis f. sp. tritici]KAH9442596.1 hypothetical protein Pst134EA_031754 [Puccinia striiformis f. sp. tritici]